MENVTLLSGLNFLCDLQSITFWYAQLCSARNGERDALEWLNAPVRPAEHHLWLYVYHGMENVKLSSGLTLPSDLQSITFGLCSTTACGT